MIRFRLASLLREKAYREDRSISWSEVADAVGVSRQALATLAASPDCIVTNTAHVEALCRFFKCSFNDLMDFDPPLRTRHSYHIDQLYPDRRTQGHSR